MDKRKYTSLSVSEETKKTLDSVKGGKSYNRLIRELVNLWEREHRVKRTGMLTRIRDFFARRRR